MTYRSLPFIQHSWFRRFGASVLSGAFMAVSVMGLLAITPSKLLPNGLITTAFATKLRVKDISHIKGVRNNQVVGYGLVVGLNRTGDQSRSTLNAEFNLIRNMGGRLNNENDIRSTNTAAAVVTAIIPPFAKQGDQIDVIVSSMKDAKSLTGGTLVATQLLAPNGEVIAVAQGPISTGGVVASSGGSSKQTAITTTGRVPNGGIIERDIMTDIGDDFGVELVLDRTDFGMSSRLAKVITANLAPASAVDGSSVRVNIPDEYLNNRVGFIAELENLSVESSPANAKVIVNERTGTIVIGSGVRLLPAAVAHGGITVTIKTTNEISQPESFSGGQTTGVTNSTVDVTEEKGSLIQLSGGASLNDLVSALNAIGVTPTDLISILQALKAAGSLEAQLEII